MFDHYDYSIIGNDDHLDDIAEEARASNILRRDYMTALMRDLRGTRHGNRRGEQ